MSSAANDLASEGWVWYVKEPGATPERIVGPLNSALGLAWLHQRLYVSSVVPVSGDTYAGRVTAYWGFTGSRFEHSQVVVDGIPVGQHRVDSSRWARTTVFISGSGARWIALAPTAPLSAAVISFRATGGTCK